MFENIKSESYDHAGIIKTIEVFLYNLVGLNLWKEGTKSKMGEIAKRPSREQFFDCIRLLVDCPKSITV